MQVRRHIRSEHDMMETLCSASPTSYDALYTLCVPCEESERLGGLQSTLFPMRAAVNRIHISNRAGDLYCGATRIDDTISVSNSTPLCAICRTIWQRANAEKPCHLTSFSGHG